MQQPEISIHPLIGRLLFKSMEGKGYQVRKYNGEYCYLDIAVREEDFHPLEAGETSPFDKPSEQIKLNI